MNNYVKSVLDNDENLNHLFVTGEISNYKPHYSGHMYMTIKDETASIKAVMFAGNASRLKFKPENGMKVIVNARLSSYERDGVYQLYINEMQPDGVGALHIKFEQLKEKLSKEGLFLESNKKPIPPPRQPSAATRPRGASFAGDSLWSRCNI